MLKQCGIVEDNVARAERREGVVRVRPMKNKLLRRVDWGNARAPEALVPII